MNKENRIYIPIDKLYIGHQNAAIQTFIKNNEINEIYVVKKLIQLIQKTQHSFLDIQNTADDVFYKQSVKQSLLLAKRLYVSKSYQARSLGVLILGRLAVTSNESLAFLKLQVSQDTDWHVIEIMPRAFNRYCADIGYEDALPVIREWLADADPNVRRAVTEGLRVWTGRPYFIKYPSLAIQLLSALRNDESAYVRDSVGNALSDISKDHPALVKNELAKWDITMNDILQTHTLASKYL
ncbi:MAG: hypothetical protein ACJASL_004446 [Paraglaciecola sp.]|jgi:hypothetical protein